MRFETIKDCTLFFLLFPFLCLLTGYVLGERQGLIAGCLFTLIVMGGVYFFPELYITKILPSTLLEGRDPWNLSDQIKSLSDKAQIKKPSVYILDIEVPTSFSISQISKPSQIYISQSILHSFSQKEVLAILSYEIARIRLQKTLSFNFAGFGLFILYSVSTALDTLLTQIIFFYKIFFQKRGNQSKISLFQKLISPLSCLLLRLFVPPSTFYKSDSLAAKLTDDPDTLAQVLWKLKSYSVKRKLPVLPQAAHYFIIHPNIQSAWSFHQPTVESRIQKLMGQFPI